MRHWVGKISTVMSKKKPIDQHEQSRPKKREREREIRKGEIQALSTIAPTHSLTPSRKNWFESRVRQSKPQEVEIDT